MSKTSPGVDMTRSWLWYHDIGGWGENSPFQNLSVYLTLLQSDICLQFNESSEQILGTISRIAWYWKRWISR